MIILIYPAAYSLDAINKIFYEFLSEKLLGMEIAQNTYLRIFSRFEKILFTDQTLLQSVVVEIRNR